MTPLAIAIGFLGLLGFLGFQSWLKRQDFESQFKRDVESLRHEVGDAGKAAGNAALNSVAERFRGIEARLGRIEAFAGIETKE